MAIEQLGSRRTRLEVRADDGTRYTIEARYLVDASGRDALLSTRKKLKRRSRQHQSAALFSRFRNAARRPGEDAGNVSIYRFEHGWMWMIPLPDDSMSVGAVCWPEYLKRRRGDTRTFLLDTLRQNAALWQRLQGAELIDEVRAAGNYSYDATRMAGPGWILVGDAFAFLDPVFSSGVFLAMDGAERAVEVIDGALREPEREAALQRALEKRLRVGMARFAFFVHRFNEPVMRSMFASPRNTWELEQGVISMLAGDLYDPPRVLRRLRLFKLVYGVMVLRNLRQWWAAHRYRLAQARAD